MPTHRTLLLLVLCVDLILIIALGSRLPPMVASHFDASGVADGSMSRANFVLLMAGVAIGLPLAVWSFCTFATAIAPLNVPHGDQWNDPANKPAAVRYLEQWSAWFAAALSLFLTALFALIVRAHLGQGGPPSLPLPLLYPLLGLFLLYTVGATRHLVRHFQRGPGT